jgi:antitoxin (DNA-binding transcriptional repressor) of toxin-antitoxin stability system
MGDATHVRHRGQGVVISCGAPIAAMVPIRPPRRRRTTKTKTRTTAMPERTRNQNLNVS